MARQSSDPALFRHTLNTGLRVVVEEIPHVRSVAVGFWIKSGSADELPAEAGHAHLLEHMLFKGTQSRSALAIAEAVEGRGGQMNAGTGRESTCLYARVLDQHFAEVFEILSDMLIDPRLQADDLEREARVVAEEIRMYLDAPDEVCHDLLLDAMWHGHAMSRSILGTLETVSTASRDSIRDFYTRHYCPEGVVVAVAGNVSSDAVMTEVERLFGGWSRAAQRAACRPPEFEPRRRISHRDVEQVHLCLGCHGPHLDHDLLYPATVLVNVLGGGTASRLFQALREEAGLAYSVYAFQMAMQATGLLGIYAATSPDTVQQATELLGMQLERVRREGVTVEELLRTREQLKGNLMLGLEGTGARMSRLGKSELLQGRILSPDQLIAKIDAVTQEDVMLVAETAFAPDTTAVAAVGPVTAGLDLWSGEGLKEASDPHG